jgi:hypothetical protein
MNTSHSRTERIVKQLAEIWRDSRHASQRLTAINRPWIAQQTTTREN